MNSQADCKAPIKSASDDRDASEMFADAPMIVRGAEAGGFVRVNAAFRATVGFDEQELRSKSLLDWVMPADRDALRATLTGERDSCLVNHLTRSGEMIRLDIQVATKEQDTIVLGRRAHDSRQSVVREEDASEATVRGTLATIARIVEEQNPGYKCSILLVADGRFVSGAGPSLPDAYNAAIDGYAIGPTVGSCGTAIYWNTPVIVEDIQADPLWTVFRELAKTAGVAACWSHPFTSKGGRVLGALALYSPTPRAPTREQLSRLRAAARMTGLAVERGRAEEALREKRKRELELEDQLRQAAKMEALGVLAGGVAHDFNNVLAAILGNAEFALEFSPSEEIARMLGDIIDASKRAGDFCKQMLAYAGRGTLTNSLIEVGALLPQLSSLVQAALSKKATLEYSLHDEKIFVNGDENQLLQVIMNLVTNAAEALGDSEGTIVVGSELAQYDDAQLLALAPDGALPAGEYVRLTVRDNGCGMDAETVERIFDPFFTTKFTGRGLGLAAVRGIVQGHGGVIQIESKLGKGTAFTVLLPTAKGPKEALKESADEVQETSRLRVLLVDDEEALRNILCRRLRHSGFDVTEAADGEQAIAAFSNDPSIDCVVLDLSMPKLDGEEVHRAIRLVRNDVPVIVMSGFTEKEVLERFEKANISGVLQKPVPAKDLISAITEATTV